MFSHIKELFTRPSGYTIARSVRLRSSASAYFNRTPASATNRTKWTWSGWVKRGTLGATQFLFDATAGVGTRLYFTSADVLQFDTGGAGVFTTTQVFRDPSAWYHVVFVADTTQATASNRIKLYINGVQVTSFSATSYPAQNTSMDWNNNVAHYLGRNGNASVSYLDGYLTEINNIDGQALTPSSFGETDSITGVWKPKAYSGTYGTNGFELNFSNNSSNTATTIGKDYSGNGNNWTPNNISVTAGVTYDSMVDSPTVSAVSSNYAVWNQLQKTSTLSQANLLSAGGGSAIFYSVASTISIPSGKWYWEITCVSNTDGLTGIVETNQMINVIRNGNYVGQTSLGYGYHANGNKYNNGSSSAYGSSYTTGDVIGVAFDADNRTLTFYKNNVSQGTAFTVTSGYTWLPADSVYTSDSKAANFGQRPFSYTPPTGFVALNTNNLPVPTIKNGAGYMNVVLYTGTVLEVTTTFSPDLYWAKSRNNVYNHGVFDSLRNQLLLNSNTTAAEAFSIDAYGLGDGSNRVSLNNYSGTTDQAGYTYVGWYWKAGGNSGVSNTNGTLTSTVSANTTAGFSVCTYTAPSSSQANSFGHGLGVAPSMVITKNRSSGTGGLGWAVYHASLGANQVLSLNTTAASATVSGYWGSGMTSTVVGLPTCASSTGFDNCTGNMVAYCFSAVAGYSAFGSYTANASADGPFIYTGFRPRWIMLKRSSAAGAPWSMFDTSRNTYNSTNLELDANTSSAESTSGNGMDILSNGFKLRDSAYLNSSSGDTFIYAAFAENPFKLSLAR